MKKTLLLLATLLTHFHGLKAQQVPILAYTIDANGQVEITVASTEDHYYVLYVRHSATGNFDQATSISLGKNGSTTLSESLAAYPQDHYKVLEHLISKPDDTDGDGTDDITELKALGESSPLNAAPPINFIHGTVCVPDRLTFKKLSTAAQQVNPGSSAEGVEELKFYMTDRDADEPRLYFVNSNTHSLHTDFAASVGLFNNGTLMTGSIIFHPFVKAPNGTQGVYRFFFQPNNAFTLPYVQKAMELLAANLPFLKNNLCYYPLPQAALPQYLLEKEQYDASRVCVLLDADLYADVDYVALHAAEGYGFLRVMPLNETPGPRDVVLYEALPNSLPRVGGILTTVMQTPLSHVNLRAIQDNVPNAFIRDALQIPGIDSLIGKYVYFKAEQAQYILREASKQEVDAFYASIRPKETLVPLRDLSKTKIEPLDSISFEESSSFGVKCANVATMRGFGFPGGTIPNGFGIPFYFYDEFMKYNGFYEKLKTLLADANFQSDINLKIQRLDDFRKAIKNGAMPLWMINALTAMQQSFPAGTAIRCRSSTNNEDLPGFSGAGLYDSKTQYPDEGHISKSIKQVYASMWNFRAFEEREFYRIDHFKAAMGILVHANHDQERANGVGVSTDPLYQTQGTFYLNTQVGEDLVTNPNALSIPEEILLDAIPATEDDYFVMNPSNQVPDDSLIMKPFYLDQMRVFLQTIHDRFKVLYKAEDQEHFAMEIEYKINAEGQLIIKQARPWSTFWAGYKPPTGNPEGNRPLFAYPNPFGAVLNVDCAGESEMQVEIYNVLGQRVHQERIDFRKDQRQIATGALGTGAYWLRAVDTTGYSFWSGTLIKAQH